jgi:hypothetical protein
MSTVTKRVSIEDLKNPNFPLEDAVAWLVEFSGYTPKDARGCVMRHRHGAEKRTKNLDGTTTVIMFS